MISLPRILRINGIILPNLALAWLAFGALPKAYFQLAPDMKAPAFAVCLAAGLSWILFWLALAAIVEAVGPKEDPAPELEKPPF